MALTIGFTQPATVNTGGAFLAAASVYDSGHTTWVYLGFRTIANVASVQISTDGGLTWAMKNMPSASTWRGLAYASTLGTAGRLVAVGNGVAAWSDDGGVNWSAATSLPEANNWIDVTWWAAKAIFVAVASSGTHRVMTSADGKSWTNQTAAAASDWSGIAVSATVAVAVTNNSSASTQQVMTSPDGAAWSLQTHASIKTNRGTVSSATRHGIGYSPDLDMFLITGTDAGNITAAYRSTDDGVTWTASQAIPTISNTTNRGYVWLAAASSWYLSCANANYGESTDGDTWTVTATPGAVTHSGYTPVGWDDTSAVLIAGTTLGFDTVLRGAVVSLDSLSPDHGPIAGGTVVTLHGIGLSAVAAGAVLFDTTAASDVVPAANGLSVTCLAPAHAAGAVNVTITGIGTLTAAYTYVTITRVTPASGTFAGSTAVTITGSGFSLATGPPTFGGTAMLTYSLVSDTTITGTTPPHALGAVDVVIPGVGTGTALYTYVVPANLLPPIPYQEPVTQNGTNPSDLLRGQWVRWLMTLKQRVEAGPSTEIPASQVLGVLDPDQIPQLPSSRLTLTNVPRLLGRTSSGSGDSEEIQVAAGLRLSGGILSLGGLPSGFVIGDLLYADSASTLARLADVAAGSYLRSGGVGAAPVWSTLTLPNTVASGGLLYASALNTLSVRTIGSSGDVLAVSGGFPTWTATSALSVPYTSITSVPTATVLGRNTAGTGAAEALGTLPSAVQDTITRLGTIVSGIWSAGAVTSSGAITSTLAAGNSLVIDTTTLVVDATNHRVGIGTAAPTDQLHLVGAVTGKIRLERASSTAFFEINLSSDSRTQFLRTGVSGSSALIDIDPNPLDGTSASQFRFFRSVTTSGAVEFDIFKGDGSATFNAIISGNKNTFFSAAAGNVGIGITSTEGGSNQFPGTGTKGLIFGVGTALATMAASTAGLYASSVGSTAGLFAINEAGLVTHVTGHTGRALAQTAAVASVVALTVGAADSSFEVSANVLVTTATTHSFTVTCAYTDEGNTARTVTLNFSTVAGVISNAAIANAGGAVPYLGVPIRLRAKASTTITLATTGTFTTVTYNVEGLIRQVS